MPEPSTRSRRPESVIRSDIEVTSIAWEACKRVVRHLLAERRDLLSIGWPATHALCEDLDAAAAKWAGSAEQIRRAVLDLQRELNPEGTAGGGTDAP